MRDCAPIQAEPVVRPYWHLLALREIRDSKRHPAGTLDREAHTATARKFVLIGLDVAPCRWSKT